jgi:signal transduction histidine kinase
MINLVNSLLNISRIESGRIIIDPKPTNVSMLLDEITKQIKIRFKDKYQKIEFKIQNDIPLINIDPQLIRQVFINLITNAAKYTPNHGEITIQLYIKDQDIITKIKDNGYGILENEKKRIFDKFFRGTNIIGQVSDGTGLGLYFIKTIVDLSQGKIWFESKENSGTTFYVSLPLSGTPAKKGVVSISS